MLCLPLMNLKILLPFEVFTDQKGVAKMVAVSLKGSFGLLPHRLDCVAALSPGILTYQNEGTHEVYVAIDRGVLVKTGLNVLVSVRNAVSGLDLSQLRKTVDQEFLKESEDEQKMRQVMEKMEDSFLRRLEEFHHG